MAVIVVTGASGLTGRTVTAQLSKSHDVVAVTRAQDRAICAAKQIVADLCNPGFTVALPARADAVVHLAQSDQYNDFPEGSEHVLTVNVVALARLLDWARRAGVTSFVHTSTGGLYGRGAHPFKESDPVRIEGRLSFYFRTKQCAELLAQSYASFFSVVALRPFFIYGRGQRSQMLMPRLAASIREGRPVRLAGAQGIKVNPLHVDDLAAAVEVSLGLQGCHVFNVAGPEILAIREIANTLGAALGLEPRFENEAEEAEGNVVGSTALLRARQWLPTIRFSEVAEEVFASSDSAGKRHDGDRYRHSDTCLLDPSP